MIQVKWRVRKKYHICTRESESFFLLLFSLLDALDVFLFNVVFFGQDSDDEIDLVALDKQLLGAGFLTRCRRDGAAGRGAHANLFGQVFGINAVRL